MLPDDPDNDLTLAQKLSLIKWIPIRQMERWQRIKFWHNTDLSMSDRHFFMRRELELIRRQQERLIKLEKEVLT